jgi:hypothetical protein
MVVDVVKYHRDRIHTEHRLLTGLSDCDIVDTVQRYYSHYSDVDHDQLWSHEPTTPSVTLSSKWNKPHRTNQKLAPSALLHYFSMLQIAETQEDRIMWRQKFLGTLASVALLTLSLAQTDLNALSRKLELTPVGGGGVHPRVPLVFHTTRTVARARGPLEYQEEIPGGYDAQDPLFHKVLGLPLLDADDTLAFCSDNVRTIIALHLMASGLSTVLQKADVLENVYIW